MGGQKKKSFSQMDRALKGKAEQPKGGKPAPAKPAAAKATGLVDRESAMKEVAKMKVATPSSVAAQLGIKVSHAKELLEDLAQQGVVKLVGGSSRLKIYQPTPAA